MTLTGAAFLLIVGILLILFTLGILHLIGVICAVIGAVCLVMALVARSRV